MPVAGDEGYEKVVICPYDRAHEVRQGRMQFHLEKCRKNHLHSGARYEKCILNSNHTIPSVEMEYHLNYECQSRKDWLRNQVDLDRANCPVGDLVPVNAGIVPDSEECWDNIEGNSSVLDKIKQEAVNKPILRLFQCESKAKRKNFRQAEHLRHGSFRPDDASSVQSDETPSVTPKLKSNINIQRQEPAHALQTLDRVFKPQEEYPTLETGSNFSAPTIQAQSTVWANNRPSSTISSRASLLAGPSTSHQNTASAMSLPDERPISAASTRASLLAGPSTSHQNTATAMSLADERPISAASSYASATSTGTVPSNRRPTIAMNIAASASCVTMNPSEEGFSTVPIPGRGRGRRLDIRGLPQK